MRTSTKILNLLTAFMAVIGVCAAALVCFIVIYTNINEGFSPKNNNSSSQSAIADSANTITDNATETAALSEKDPFENDFTINLDSNNYAPTEMQSSEIVENSTQSTDIKDTNENNFNIYYNPDQQQTINNYVLNTNPDRMKIHYPSCNYVTQIAPENYATSNLSVSELESLGYTTCGHCF